MEYDVGSSFDGFTIQKFTEVFAVDYEGKELPYPKSSFLRSYDLALSFAQNQSPPPNVHYKIRDVFGLTDGVNGILIKGLMSIVSEEDAKRCIRAHILDNLSETERGIMLECENPTEDK